MLTLISRNSMMIGSSLSRFNQLLLFLPPTVLPVHYFLLFPVLCYALQQLTSTIVKLNTSAFRHYLDKNPSKDNLQLLIDIIEQQAIL